jgi:hypothetical protein
MIDRNNWIAAREFYHEHERHANALRRTLRSERRKKGIMNRIFQCVYDSLPGIASPTLVSQTGFEVVSPRMISEIAVDFDVSKGRGFSDGNFLAQVLR